MQCESRYGEDESRYKAECTPRASVVSQARTLELGDPKSSCWSLKFCQGQTNSSWRYILAGVLELIQEGALQSGHQAINCDRFCAKVGKVLQEIKMKLHLLLLSIATQTISAQRLVEAGTLVRRDLHSLN